MNAQPSTAPIGKRADMYTRIFPRIPYLHADATWSTGSDHILVLLSFVHLPWYAVYAYILILRNFFGCGLGNCTLRYHFDLREKQASQVGNPQETSTPKPIGKSPLNGGKNPHGRLFIGNDLVSMHAIQNSPTSNHLTPSMSHQMLPHHDLNSGRISKMKYWR
ncbi:MAG: hypothetical protein M1834_000071 [Cirrosporium novae-zelandiae]|nr:MAG: hypothetical protein M1834_000071 [Cirrosporium novae-zelandiae]